MPGVILSSKSQESGSDKVPKPVDTSSNQNRESSWTDAPFLTENKKARWMNGWGEMSVEDSGENYLLKYREGRFNPSVIEGGEFEILDNAVEFGDKIAGGDWEIDTDPVWHRSKLCLEKDGYSINVYENDTEQDYVVLTATESRGVDELKSGYVGEEVEMAEYVGELLDYVEIRERSGEEAAEISEFFRNF